MNIANQTKYPFILPDLPFKIAEFGERISEETFHFHHKMHHNAYVANLNKLLESYSDLCNKTLEELIIISSQDKSLLGIFNNAAQIWNHTFYWHSITPNYKTPTGKILELINRDFGSIENFNIEFENAGVTQFGSGWAWLVVKDNRLSILKTSNADNPICNGYIPILNCDVWEHAYYIDYRNKRVAYLKDFISNLINWEFANKNVESINL
jgi:Fe-Mn family superoxide dismutase